MEIVISEVVEPTFVESATIEHKADRFRLNLLAGDLQSYLLSKGFYCKIEVIK